VHGWGDGDLLTVFSAAAAVVPNNTRHFAVGLGDDEDGEGDAMLYWRYDLEMSRIRGVTEL
jgi:hypothetical protein